jgi:hypothetical protein
MSNQTERMEDALRRVIGEKIAAEGEAERLRAEVARQERVNKGWAELWNHVPRHWQEQARSALAGPHRQARSLGDQALGVCEVDGESWPCRNALAGTEAHDA